MGAVLALAMKDLRLLLRDRAGFFFTVFFPLLVAVFFGTVFAGMGDGGGAQTPRTRIVVVDEDKSAGSERFVRTLAEAPELAVESAAALDAGLGLVRRGRAAGCVRIPAGFGDASARMFHGGPARLELTTDPSKRAKAGMLAGILTKYAYQRMQDLLADPPSMIPQVQAALAEVRRSSDPAAAERRVLEPFLEQLNVFLRDMPAATADADGGGGSMSGWKPVEIEAKTLEIRGRAGPPNAYTVSFPQGVIWGFIGCMQAFAISIVLERSRGTLVRISVSPASRWHVLGGKALACFVTTVAVAAVLLLIGRVFFDVRAGSPGLLAAAVAAIAVCFVGIMMLVSVLGSSERAVAGLGWAIMLVFAMIGGGMIPLFIMPGWMQTVSHVSPVKWAALALDGAIWREFTPAQMALPLGVLVAVGAVSFLLGSVVFARTARV